MAIGTRSNRTEGVESYSESDGSVTAKDIETGLARDTRAEALAQLADVLELHEGGVEPVDDPDELLEAEFDPDADDPVTSDDRDRPEFMR